MKQTEYTAARRWANRTLNSPLPERRTFAAGYLAGLNELRGGAPERRQDDQNWRDGYAEGKAGKLVTFGRGRVSLDDEGRTARFDMLLTPSLLAGMREAAAGRGVSLSEYVTSLVKADLGL